MIEPALYELHFGSSVAEIRRCIFWSPPLAALADGRFRLAAKLRRWGVSFVDLPARL